MSNAKFMCRPYAFPTCFISIVGPAIVFLILTTFPAAEWLLRLYFAVLVALVSLATAYSEVKIHVSKTFVKKDYALIKVPEFPISLRTCRRFIFTSRLFQITTLTLFSFRIRAPKNKSCPSIIMLCSAWSENITSIFLSFSVTSASSHSQGKTKALEAKALVTCHFSTTGSALFYRQLMHQYRFRFTLSTTHCRLVPI